MKTPTKTSLSRQAKKKARILAVKKLYDKHRSIYKVGERLGITAERVRQLLHEGEKLGFFVYKRCNQRKLERRKTLNKRYSKEFLTKKIMLLKGRDKIRRSLEISWVDLAWLIKKHKIDYEKCLQEGRLQLHRKRYFQIVKALGYHPTLSELNSTKEGYALFARLRAHWGNIGNFRKEFGIKAEAKHTRRKRKKKEKILRFIRKKGAPSRYLIMKSCKIGSKYPCLQYLRELIAEGKVKRIPIKGEHHFGYEALK